MWFTSFLHSETQNWEQKESPQRRVSPKGCYLPSHIDSEERQVAQEAEQILRAKFNCSGLCKTFSLLRRLRRLDFASSFQPSPWTVKHCAPIKIWPQLWVLKTNKCSQRKSSLLDLTQSQLNQVLDWALRTFVLRRKKLDLPLVLCTMQTYPERQPALQGASRLRRDGEGRGSYGHSILVAGPWTGDSIYFKNS